MAHNNSRFCAGCNYAGTEWVGHGSPYYTTHTCHWPDYIGGAGTDMTQAEYVLRRIKGAGGGTTGEVHQFILDWQYGPGNLKYNSVTMRGSNCTAFYGYDGYVKNYCVKDANKKWQVIEEIKPGPHGWYRPDGRSKARQINDNISNAKAQKENEKSAVENWKYLSHDDRVRNTQNNWWIPVIVKHDLKVNDEILEPYWK